MVRDLKYFKDPILKVKCDRVLDVVGNAELKQDIQDMIDTMQRYKGCGLSASQIGITKRIAVVERNDGSIVALINPFIESRSDKLISAREGCLSYPRLTKNIKRAEWVHVAYYDTNGLHILDIFEGLEARIVQHEIDHMDGICKVGV